MADPITVIQLISAATSLATQCAQAIKALHDLASRMKNAEMSIRSMANELDIIRLAWEVIQGTLLTWREQEESDQDLLQRLGQSLEFGVMIVEFLAEDLRKLKTPFNFARRSKFVWSEKQFRDHQDRIRGQVGAMNLLVSVLKLPSKLERTTFLQQGAEVLRKSDESAYSIVPSHQSSRPESICSTNSASGFESAELVYRQLIVDDELFTAQVYKRNYRNRRMDLPAIGPRKMRALIDKEQPTQQVITGGPSQEAQCIDFEDQQDREKYTSQYSDRIWLKKQLWRTREGASVHGPAVSLDLASEIKVIEGQDMRDSVSQCQPVLLVYLLRHLQFHFSDWRGFYFREACEQERIDVVEVLLDNALFAAPGALGAHRKNAIFHIAYNKGPENLLQLVKTHTDVGPGSMDLDVVIISLLLRAFSESRNNIIDCLVSFRAPERHKLLCTAIKISSSEVVARLLRTKDIDINEIYPDHAENYLHLTYSTYRMASGSRSYYITKGQRQIIRFLIAHGADIAAQDINGDTIYHLAARSADAFSRSLCEVDVDHGRLKVALESTNINGDTPLKMAERTNNYALLDLVRRYAKPVETISEQSAEVPTKSPHDGSSIQTSIDHEIRSDEELHTDDGNPSLLDSPRGQNAALEGGSVHR